MNEIVERTVDEVLLENSMLPEKLREFYISKQTKSARREVDGFDRWLAGWRLAWMALWNIALEEADRLVGTGEPVVYKFYPRSHVIERRFFLQGNNFWLPYFSAVYNRSLELGIDLQGPAFIAGWESAVHSIYLGMGQFIISQVLGVQE